MECTSGLRVKRSENDQALGFHKEMLSIGLRSCVCFLRAWRVSIPSGTLLDLPVMTGDVSDTELIDAPMPSLTTEPSAILEYVPRDSKTPYIIQDYTLNLIRVPVRI